MLEHGGNLDLALQHFGGRLEDWIDLSTGINRQPYPVPKLSPRHWGALPSRSETDALHEAALQAYGTRASIVALAGAQAAIQLLPRLSPPGRARILSPSYNEYAPVLRAAGWDVADVADLKSLAGADPAVVRKILRTCRSEAGLCTGQRGRYRRARCAGRSLAGLGRRHRDRTARVA